MLDEEFNALMYRWIRNQVIVIDYHGHRLRRAGELVNHMREQDIRDLDVGNHVQSHGVEPYVSRRPLHGRDEVRPKTHGIVVAPVDRQPGAERTLARRPPLTKQRTLSP